MAGSLPVSGKYRARDKRTAIAAKPSASYVAGMTDYREDDYGHTIEAQLIADYVSEGTTLIDAARTLGVPLRTVYNRINSHPLFAEMMETARAVGYDVIANNTRRVARGEEGYSTGDWKRDRLVVEQENKLLAKWHPSRYGEKLQVEQKTATISIPVSDDPIAAQRAYEQLMKGG